MADILSFRPRPQPAVERLAPLDQLAVRDEIEAAAQAALDTADKLISLLDRIDRDADLEDSGDDEPSLGAPEEHGNNLVWFRGTARDLELNQLPEIDL